MCPSPTLGGVCHTSLLFQAFPSPSTLGEVAPHPPSPAGLFIYSSVRECPSPSLWSSGCPALFAMCLFFFSCLLIIQFGFFSLFSLGGGQSVQGTMLIWPRVVCGSTACRLAHMVVSSPKQDRRWCLVAREPSWFLRLTWSGDAMHGLGVLRVRVLPLLGGFSCKVHLQRLSKILF
jgi:hypothetical protein